MREAPEFFSRFLTSARSSADDGGLLERCASLLGGQLRDGHGLHLTSARQFDSDNVARARPAVHSHSHDLCSRA